MQPGLEKELQGIMSDLECAKDFICYTSGFETLGKVKAGPKRFIKCLEEPPYLCSFSWFLGTGYYCKCPLRNFIFNKLEK
jgi:hypothetical protein